MVDVTPELAIDLRLRFLETLLSGRPTNSVVARAAPTTSTSTSTPFLPLARRADLIQTSLNSAIEKSGGGGDAVRRFVQGYDLNEPLLRLPPVAATDGDLSAHAKVALILESEGEIRQLERDLRELDTLDQRGVVGAGSLAAHESLKPSLLALKENTTPLSSSHASLEKRTNDLLAHYNEYIGTLSEIFVSWNDVVSSAEQAVSKLEKARSTVLDVA